jgi:hypothetical protein
MVMITGMLNRSEPGDAATLIEPAYVPPGRREGSAVTWMLPCPKGGAVPDAGETESQFPPLLAEAETLNPRA